MTRRPPPRALDAADRESGTAVCSPAGRRGETTTILLVRHGETAWNAERRLQGNEDVELSEQGRAQARSLRPLIQAIEPSHVVCSPLVRARETLRLLEREPDTIDERWQEADLGAWTGQKQEDLVAAGAGYEQWRAGRLVPPGGEDLAGIRERVTDALDDLEGLDTVLVVTHGGPIRAACSVLVGLDTARIVPVMPGSLTSFEVSGPGPRLLNFNVLPAHRAIPGRAEQAD